MMTILLDFGRPVKGTPPARFGQAAQDVILTYGYPRDNLTCG